MISVTSSLASSMPATSAKVIPVISLFMVRWRDLPKEPSMPPPAPALRRPRLMPYQSSMRSSTAGAKRMSSCTHWALGSVLKSPLVISLTRSKAFSPVRALRGMVTVVSALESGPATRLAITASSRRTTLLI